MLSVLCLHLETQAAPIGYVRTTRAEPAERRGCANGKRMLSASSVINDLYLRTVTPYFQLFSFESAPMSRWKERRVQV